MTTLSGGEGLLTLEPLIEVVREAVQTAGWELSGLQKTTSHQFEGRWEGESTRSAYVFFHSPMAREPVSIDVYLDETSRGLSGNLALVVDLVDLGDLPDPAAVMRELGTLASAKLPDGHNAPLTLRLRLKDGADEPEAAESEVRFKLRISRAVIGQGARAVQTLVVAAVRAFEEILGSAELKPYIAQD